MKKQTKLIFYCLAMCIVAVACIFGVLAVKNFSLVSGGVIKFVAPGVDATISDATLTGLSKKTSSGTMSTFTVTSTMTASQIEALDGYKSWSGIHLLFDDESEGKGTISFTITNNSSKSIENIMVELSTNTTSVSAIQTTPSADFCIAPGASHTFSVNLSVVNVDESVILDDFELVVDLGVIKESQVTSVEEYQASGLTFATNSSARTASFTQFAIPQGTTENLQVEIPSVVKDSAGNVYTVTTIKGSSATNNPFASVSDKMTKVTLPETLTTIGAYAFYNCSALSGELVIPDGVTEILTNAFYNCKSLSGKLKFPSSLKIIGNSTFQNCDGFSGDLIIPEGVTSIGNYAFFYCKGFSGKLVLPSTLLSIDRNAFYGCTGLTGDLVIPSNVTTIGSNAFRDCTKLDGNLVIPASAIDISENAFHSCGRIAGIIVDKANTKYYVKNDCLIERSTGKLMKGCNTGVVPTDGTITEIVEGSFYGCTLLSSTITIPASVTKIGLFAFHNCYNITGIIVENGNPTYYSVNNCLIEKSTGILIKGCNNSVIPNDGTITQIADYAFYSCNSLSGNLIIPNGVVSVGIGAFGYCGYRGVLEIPSSVAYIGESAFCSLRFSSISVDSSNTVYYSVGNCLIEYTTGTLLQGCPSSIIPNDGTIKIIEKNAFNGCASASIIIPESVTTINARAFEYCAALTSIVVPKNVTFIDNYAFNNCTSFTSITISATVPPTIGATNVFTNTNNCPIYVPAASVAAYKTAQNWSSYASRIQAISA